MDCLRLRVYKGQTVQVQVFGTSVLRLGFKALDLGFAIGLCIPCLQCNVKRHQPSQVGCATREVPPYVQTLAAKP